MIHRTDEEHLAAATLHGFALYSFNVRDFHEIHTEWMMAARDHAGIILAQQRRYSVGDQIGRLMRLMGAFTAETMRNREGFLGRW